MSTLSTTIPASPMPNAVSETRHPLMKFETEEGTGVFDIVDGMFTYSGSLPVDDAAKALFESLTSYIKREALLSYMETGIPASPMPNATNTTTPQTQTPGAVEGPWHPMKDAPRDGTPIVAHYFEKGPEGNYDAYAVIEWDALDDFGWVHSDSISPAKHRFEAWKSLGSPYEAALRATPAIDTAAQPVTVRAAFEAWAFAQWTNSHPPHNAWLGWEACAERACIHPASATPEAETLRAEVERLTKERDEALDEVSMMQERINQLAYAGQSEEDAIARAEAAEAKLAALAQPAPEGKAEVEKDWTGEKCPHCKGHGRRELEDGEEHSCPDCGGTGDEYGPVPAALAPERST